MATNNNSAQEAIKAYLDKRAATDEQFAAVYAKPHKSIDECFRYILSEAQKRGNAVCMTDEEVFGLAVHYYDEDDIKVRKTATEARATHSAQAQKVELTEEQKAVALKRAMELYEQECIADQREMAKKAKPKAKKELTTEGCYSPSLFNLDEL